MDEDKTTAIPVETPLEADNTSRALSTTLTVDSAIKVKRIVSLLRGLSRLDRRGRPGMSGLTPDRATLAAFAELPRHERRAALARLRKARKK